MTSHRRVLECFRLLELPPDAPLEDVRTAYRTLCRVWHPDRFAGDADLVGRANARQQELNAAYRELLHAYRTGAAPVPHEAAAGDGTSPFGEPGSAPSSSATPPAATAPPPAVRPSTATRATPRWRRGPGRRRAPSLLLGALVLLTLALLVTRWGTRSSDQVDSVPGRAVDAHTFAAGGGHACAGVGAGILCWGRNAVGSSGGGWGTRPAGVDITLPAAAEQVAVGLDHSCALLTDGSVHCWGANFAGQLGDRTLQDRRTPSRVARGIAFAEVSTLGQHTCARARDGDVYCWGNDTDGQLGIRTPVASCRWGEVRFHCTDSPARVAGGPWRSVAAGGSHGCAIDGRGLVWCWGSNRYGQLGASTTGSCAGPGGEQPCSRSPVRSALQAPAAAVVTGASHTCALDEDGRAVCWGLNRYGQAGHGSPGDVAAPGPVAGDLRFRSLAAGGYHTCGVTDDGALYCWGRNEHGELRGRAPDRCDGAPCAAAPLRAARGGVTDVAAGFGVTCARRAGRLACWGRGDPAAAPEARLAAPGPSPRMAVRRIIVSARWWAGRIARIVDRLVPSLPA
jgi:alpha-tubulin suppressor-like RCC1 family protein